MYNHIFLIEQLFLTTWYSIKKIYLRERRNAILFNYDLITFNYRFLNHETLQTEMFSIFQYACMMLLM